MRYDRTGGDRREIKKNKPYPDVSRVYVCVRAGIHHICYVCMSIDM